MNAFLNVAIITVFFWHNISLPMLVSPQRTMDDFSQLNETDIHGVACPQTYDDIRTLLHYAHKNKLKISLSGQRHSQGGHTFYPNALVLDMRKFNKIISLDADRLVVTVQTGVIWSQLQEYLNPLGLAIKVMQIANIFTIGGALSVNANGIDPHYGPLIETVQSIKILTYDGSLLHASRQENGELFALALSGFGLFGIIVEADIEVTRNCLYKRSHDFIKLEEYPAYIKMMRNDPKWGLHLAYVLINQAKKRPFSDLFVINYQNTNRKLRPRTNHLFHEHFISYKRWGITLLRSTHWAKLFQCIPEMVKSGHLISRNNSMRPPVKHLHHISPRNTDLLQEYFIPIDQIVLFIKSLEDIVLKEKINIMNLALRYIPRNGQAFLSYARTDMVGIVLFFSQEKTEEASLKVQTWTRSLIDHALKLGGAYYLPIQLHATADQLKQAYPTIDQFFMLKKKYDPSELFVNHFYEKYKVLAEKSTVA